MFTQDDYIYRYSRKNAIDDGFLIDKPIEDIRKNFGIKWHCALSLDLYSKIEPTKEEIDLGQSVEGRLSDLCMVFANKARSFSGQEMPLSLIVRRAHGETRLSIKSHIGPGDDPKPVITFMLPQED